MNTTDLKLELIEWILKEKDATHLKEMHKLIKGFKQTTEDDARTVGYLPNGTAVSRKVLVDRIQASLADIDLGNLIQTDELEQESEQW
jgi:hypothetical protein